MSIQLCWEGVFSSRSLGAQSVSTGASSREPHLPPAQACSPEMHLQSTSRQEQAGCSGLRVGAGLSCWMPESAGFGGLSQELGEAPGTILRVRWQHHFPRPQEDVCSHWAGDG